MNHPREDGKIGNHDVNVTIVSDWERGAGNFIFFSSRRPEYILASVAFSIFITCSDRCGGYLRAYRVMALHGKIESTTALSVSSGQNESFLY